MCVCVCLVRVVVTVQNLYKCIYNTPGRFGVLQAHPDFKSVGTYINRQVTKFVRVYNIKT